MSSTCAFGQIPDIRAKSICLFGRIIVDSDRNIVDAANITAQNLIVRQSLFVSSISEKNAMSGILIHGNITVAPPHSIITDSICSNVVFTDFITSKTANFVIISSDVGIAGDLGVSGNVVLTQDIIIKGNIITQGNGKIISNIIESASDLLTIKGNVCISGNLFVSDIYEKNSESGINVHSNVDLTLNNIFGVNKLQVSNIFGFSPITIEDDAIMQGNLYVSPQSQITFFGGPSANVGDVLVYTANGWSPGLVSLAGATPIGPASGDLNMFYPGPQVFQLRGGNIVIPTGPDTLVGRQTVDVLTNKTLTDFSTIFQNNSDNTKKMRFQLSGISTGTTRVLTVPNANTILVGTDVTQTLTNKTFIDDSTTFQDNVDNTKRVKFELSGITTGQTRTFNFPNSNDTLVGTNFTQTLTNKTIVDTTSNITASSLFSANSTINVSLASAPSPGFVLTATDSTHATWQPQSIGPGNSVPIGAVLVWPVSTPPVNFLICDGSAISRITYSTLFNLFLTDSLPYGNGDGINTFNLPDLMQRIPMGYSGTGPTAVVGSKSGSLLTSLTVNNLPPHSHTITDIGHSHPTTVIGARNNSTSNTGLKFGTGPTGVVAGAVSVTGSTTGITINNTGSGLSFNTYPPIITMFYIIRAL